MKVVLVLLLLGAFLVAVNASRADPENWTTADWGALIISIILSVYFFVLSQLINSNAQRRAEAVANAELLTSSGLLAMNSARSLSGSESSALRVAADARAALQHYPSATDAKKTDTVNVKEDLVKSVIDAYIDLAFSTFLHSGNLARSVWTRLCKGTAAVVDDIDRLAFADSGHIKDANLASAADHVGFIELLGRALRKDAEKDLPFQGSRRLTAVWDSTKLPYFRRHQGNRSDKDEILYRLKRFETLYKYELTVMHDWEMLRRNAEKLCCEVELINAAATGEWLAPWYVGQGTDGRPKPVNVLGRDLNERARYDKLEADDSTPRWPDPLLHGSLPQGMRTTSVDNLRHVLEKLPSPTICVLAYDLCIDTKSGKTKRLVLDGNHRLAAARRISLEHNSPSEDRSPSQQFKVLTFLIRELQPINDWSATDEQKEPVRWKGFTPDIGLIRGIWRPS